MRLHVAPGFAVLLVLEAHAQVPGACLIREAREQIGVTVRYDPVYRKLSFPGGDIPSDRGVCTDVLVRAYRELNVDLQELVHRDMKNAWSAYPKLLGAHSSGYEHSPARAEPRHLLHAAGRAYRS